MTDIDMPGCAPAVQVNSLPAMTSNAVARVRALESEVLQLEQKPIATHHLIHAGLYHRTICIPAGVVLTGALIKRATTLIFHGDATIATGEDTIRVTGHHVLAGAAHRKQAFLAHADTWLTMSFPTAAKTVEQAEEEFTDEAHLLFSRHGENVINITGE